jgi:hypothetical protein
MKLLAVLLLSLAASVAGAASEEKAKPAQPDPEYCSRRDADPQKCVTQDGPPNPNIIRKKPPPPPPPPPPRQPAKKTPEQK